VVSSVNKSSRFDGIQQCSQPDYHTQRTRGWEGSRGIYASSFIWVRLSGLHTSLGFREDGQKVENGPGHNHLPGLSLQPSVHHLGSFSGSTGLLRLVPLPMIGGSAVGSGGLATYTWFWSLRGGGVRGFGSPNGWRGGCGPLFLFYSIVGEPGRTGGGSGDSVKVVGWSGVFKEAVESLRTLSGFSNGLSVTVELEYGGRYRITDL
jgi:hypothetical protein